MGRARTHGLSHTDIYNVWCGMISRCVNENNKYYKYYGGRGITVCDEWFLFENFYRWAMRNGYEKGLELDRTDNESGYSPDNCRFVTHRQNMQNTRRKRSATINGKEYSIFDLADMYGISRSTVRNRYSKGIRGEGLIAPPLRKGRTL